MADQLKPGFGSSSSLSEMAHEAESGGAGGSPQHAPQSPPRAHRVLPPADTFHQQILQNQSPRKNDIAERAKQSLENSFLTQLKKQQQLQQEILLQHFQQQRQQLAEQHEQQLRHHLKLWEQQKALEEAALREAREVQEARERHERDVRKREKIDHTPTASTQVKQKLQDFIKKKQAAANANGTVPGSPYNNRNWGIVKSSSGESITSGSAPAHPYRLPPPPPPNNNDFPLRKTASEPNMLKVRLKARVIERRASPLARRPPKCRLKRNCEGGSPRGSPPAGVGGVVGGAVGGAIREEEESPRPDPLLFSSPSLPNISLGRPPMQPAMQPVSVGLPPVSEAEALVGAVGTVGSVGSVGTMGAVGTIGGVGTLGAVGTVSEVGCRSARPLNRTQSAPLPLGHAALAPHAPHAAHNLLKEHIRRTVLIRAANLPEEEPEVMDLTKRPASMAAPLARALSSPLVGARAQPGGTGLAYDPLMLKHGCACGAHAPTHPEHGGRLQSIWARLCETGLAARGERTRTRKATLDELASVHSAAHVARFVGRAPRTLVRLQCGGVGVDSDTAWSDAHTPAAARAAAAAVLDLAATVQRRQLSNGFAVVRPPGHHAEPEHAMGFCFFNSVAIAARLLHTRHHVQRVLIVDWDVHHGNGTQQIFYEDPHVLYISLHRHDDGNFFPGTGAASECGAGPGTGYTVNIAWNGGLNPPMGDAEYLAAFRSVVMPIAKEYDPEIVLVSCGFDAASGHAAPLGGYNVSAAAFAAMTKDLMTLANGRVVLALEGGYELPALCDCAAACVRALLGEEVAPPAAAELARAPAAAAQRALRAVHAAHHRHWPVLKRYAMSIGVCAAEGAAAARRAPLQAERDAADTAAAMATLSVTATHATSPDSSRSVSEEPMEQDEGK